jgi:hypothetical protein
MPPIFYLIKFNGNPKIERFKFDTLDEMWFTLRELMMRDHHRYGIIEWMIRDYGDTIV